MGKLGSSVWVKLSWVGIRWAAEVAGQCCSGRLGLGGRGWLVGPQLGRCQKYPNKKGPTCYSSVSRRHNWVADYQLHSIVRERERVNDGYRQKLKLIQQIARSGEDWRTNLNSRGSILNLLLGQLYANNYKKIKSC